MSLDRTNRLRHILYGVCRRTKGLRRFANRATAPAFFGEHQAFGDLPTDFRQRPGRVLIAAYPKSGNVWLTSLIACCLEIPVDDDGTGCFVGYTHHPLNDTVLFDRKVVRAVVLIRDLRDVVVSLFHFMRTDHFKRVHGVHHVYDDISDMYFEYFLVQFINHVSPPEKQPYGYVSYGVPMVRYEKLFTNPERELRRLFQRWRIDVSDDLIADAIAKNSIAALQKGSGKIGGNIDPSHFRKGGHGNYRDELPQHVLVDIERRFGDHLRRWGYETETV